MTKRIPYLCGFWRFANAYLGNKSKEASVADNQVEGIALVALDGDAAAGSLPLFMHKESEQPLSAAHSINSTHPTPS